MGDRSLWRFVPWLPFRIGLDKLVAHCAFLNGAEMLQARQSAGEFLQNPFPAAQLKLTLEDFDVDCFSWEAYTLVSERMRLAMGLGATEIQYFDIDASQSAPLPRSKNYQIMHVPVTEDVSDPERSQYMTGRSHGVRVVFRSPLSIVFREGVVPKHEMFHDAFFKVVLCAEALALRVLRAGCTGVRFFDPREQIPKARFRTLRGIEESVEWDPKRKVEHTRVVQAIH